MLEEMKKELNQSLRPGEEVLWWGQPKPFALLEPSSRLRTVLIWIVSAVVLVLVPMLLIPGALRGERSVVDVVVLTAVALFLPLLFSIRPVLDKRCLEKQTLYAITNQRVITMVKEQTASLPIDKRLAVAVEDGDDGCGNLRFGACVGKVSQKSRAQAIVGVRDENEPTLTTGLLFYHIQRPGALMGYFT